MSSNSNLKDIISFKLEFDDTTRKSSVLGERTQIVKSNSALREKALGKMLLHD